MRSAILASTMPASKRESAQGRRHLQTPDDAILAAAADLIRERGYDGFSMAAVADRARVAKTTVYRRWPTRLHLVVAAMGSMMGRVALFDTGDVRADLESFARTLAATLREPGTRRLIAELALAMDQRRELEDAFHRMFAERRSSAAATVERAVAAGKLRDNVDAELVIDLVSGALYYRMLVSGEGATDAYAERLIDVVLGGAASVAWKSSSTGRQEDDAVTEDEPRPSADTAQLADPELVVHRASSRPLWQAFTDGLGAIFDPFGVTRRQSTSPPQLFGSVLSWHLHRRSAQRPVDPSSKHDRASGGAQDVDR